MVGDIGAVPGINIKSSAGRSQRRLALDTGDGDRSGLLPQYQCKDYNLTDDYDYNHANGTSIKYGDPIWTDKVTCESIACQASFLAAVYKASEKPREGNEYLEQVAQKARECDRAWLKKAGIFVNRWTEGINLSRFKQLCPDGRWTDQNMGLNIVCHKDQAPDGPQERGTEAPSRPRPRIYETKAEIVTPQSNERGRLEALRGKTQQSLGIAVDSLFAAEKWRQCNPGLYGQAQTSLQSAKAGYDAGSYAQAQSRIAAANGSIKQLINACDKTRKPGENPKSCKTIDGALEFAEVLKSAGYCKVNNLGQRDFLPVLKSTQPKTVVCKVCGYQEETGALDNCNEWTFGPYKKVGGWASPFVWCDLTEVRYWCFDEKSFDPSCFDHLVNKVK